MRATIDGWRLAPSVGDGAVHSGAKPTIKVARSPQIVHNGNPYCEPGCVLYLPGYPGTGATIRDFSGYGNHGTITGATWVRLSSGLWVQNHDGSDDKTKLAVNTDLDLSTLTVLLWFRFPTAPAADSRKCAIGYHPDDTANTTWAMDARVGWELRTITLSGTSRNTLPDLALDNTSWRLFGFTYNSATNALLYYVNEVEYDNSAADPAPAGAFTFPANSVVCLGRGYAGTYSDVQTALVREFSTILPGSTMSQIFQEERHLFGV